MRERARRLLNEARKGSTPTMEIIRASPESMQSFEDAEDKLQKIVEQVGQLEKQCENGKGCMLPFRFRGHIFIVFRADEEWNAGFGQ